MKKEVKCHQCKKRIWAGIWVEGIVVCVECAIKDRFIGFGTMNFKVGNGKDKKAKLA